MPIPIQQRRKGRRDDGPRIGKGLFRGLPDHRWFERLTLLRRNYWASYSRGRDDAAFLAVGEVLASWV
jgi:hypothetical protein